MRPCVYTTQFPIWLDAAAACAATKLISFRSNKRWAKAAELLDRHGTLPILFRRQEGSAEELACQFVAELAEIHFPNRMKSDVARHAWLDEKLWLQRDTIKKLKLKGKLEPEFKTWESQFKAWETDPFMDAETWYTIRGLRKIKPLALPCLRKLNGDKPLVSDYARGYALCHYPAADIKAV